MAASRRFDIIVVGAGPAGMAAACAAAPSGASVAVIDLSPAPGGQIWRGSTAGDSLASRWFERFRAASVERFYETHVIDRPSDALLLCDSPQGALELSFSALILATGARERFLPLPGWTLPNVFGAGGMQALAKSGLPVEGKRIVVAGSGPLLLAVAAYLRRHGAKVPLIAEQAPPSRVFRFAARLLRHPWKLAQAARLQPGAARYLTGCWPVRAEGAGKVESVTLRRGAATWSEPCDFLASGFGLVPNLELALLLGCRTARGFVAVDEWQRTSVENVYCAGEPVAIGGVDLALASGEIAGHAATARRDQARRRFAARDRALGFAAAMERAFALRDELKLLPEPETLICRCEDVPLARLRGHAGWRSAKLHTRCGMGPCQGRVCGPAAEFLLGWPHDSVRPPLFPARAGTLRCGNL
jgi:D-hydroxyproline dehydrogenase subunit alpha